MSRIRTPLFVLLAIVFFGFAYLQLEDDNPETYVNPSQVDVIKWVSFYSLIGILYLFAIFQRVPWALLILGALFSLYLLGESGPGLFRNLNSGHFDMTKTGMNPDNPPVEQSREFFGALIALAAVAFLAWRRRPSPSSAS